MTHDTDEGSRVYDETGTAADSRLWTDPTRDAEERIDALIAAMSNSSIAPAFAFGHGMSYTTFTVSDVTLDRAEIPTDGTVVASVSVTNTGDRAGATVVQLYSSGPVAQVTRPVRQLVGYARVTLEPGAATTVRFGLHVDRFSLTGLRRRRVVEPGAVELSAGLCLADLGAAATLAITGAERVVDRPHLETTVDVGRTPS